MKKKMFRSTLVVLLLIVFLVPPLMVTRLDSMTSLKVINSAMKDKVK